MQTTSLTSTSSDHNLSPSTPAFKPSSSSNRFHNSRRSPLLGSTRDNNPTTTYFDSNHDASSCNSSSPLTLYSHSSSTSSQTDDSNYKPVLFAPLSKQDFAQNSNSLSSNDNQPSQQSPSLSYQHQPSSLFLIPSAFHPKVSQALPLSLIFPQSSFPSLNRNPYPLFDNYYCPPSTMSSALPLLSPLVTKILELSGFPPELKTRDIQAVFQQWEEDRGGFKIKWRDDTTALIVFADPAVGESQAEGLQTIIRFESKKSIWERLRVGLQEMGSSRCLPHGLKIGSDSAYIQSMFLGATERINFQNSYSELFQLNEVSIDSTFMFGSLTLNHLLSLLSAKRAYLQTLLSPPPSLMTSAGVAAKIRPYDGEDASSVISQLSSRPRGRSTTGSRDQAAPAYGASSPKGGEAMLASASQGSNSGAVGGHSPQKSISRASHLGNGLGHRRTGSGSNPSSLPQKPVAAALFDAAQGGPSPATHVINGERERMEREGLTGDVSGLGAISNAPDPLAAAIDAARVGHVGESARSGKGMTLGEANAAAEAVRKEEDSEKNERGPRIGDAGRRLVAGALGKRLANKSSSSPSRNSSTSSETVAGVTQSLNSMTVEG